MIRKRGPSQGKSVAIGAALPSWLEIVSDFLRYRFAPFSTVQAVLQAEVDARRLFPWLPVATGVGVVLYFLADGTPSVWPAGTLAAALLLVAWRARSRLGAFVFCVGLSFVFLGFAAAALRTSSVAAPVLERTTFAKLSAYVETVDAGREGGRMVLFITAFESRTGVAAPQRIRTTFKGVGPRAGDHISGQVRLMPPPQPAFPGGYDFARDAYFLQLGAVGRWSGALSLAPAPQPMPHSLWLVTRIDNARTDLTNRIAQIIGGQAGALSAALVTGKRGLLDEPTNDALRASGLYHIVSISGLHMVMAAGVFFWLARAGLSLLPGISERQPIKKFAAVIAMVGATAYCIFSGSEVATERSLIMTLVMLGAILFDRPALSMRNLAIAALVVLLREPETLLGPSFQMSFAAVAAMIAAHEWWISRNRAPKEPAGWGAIWMRKAWLALLGSVVTTLIASFATATFAAYHFQRINPYGLIGNALAIPFVSFIVMPAAVGGTLLLPFGLDGPVWSLMGLGSEQVLAVARKVGEVQGAVRGMRAFPISGLLWMSAGFVFLVLVRHALRLFAFLPMAMGLWQATHVAPAEMLIDRQGTIAAVRGKDGLMVILGRGTNRFTVDRWLSADGDLRKSGAQGLRDGAQCDRLGCVTKLTTGEAVSLVVEMEAFEEDCRRAKVIISPLQAPEFCRATAFVIDRSNLAQSASIMLHRSGNDFKITPARPQNQWKPWYGRPQTMPAVLPSAAAEPQTSAPVPQEAQSDEDGSLLLP
ncbi:MAG: ComEC/Rec2 family competence protein [Beijerinckiaceae bacterium]